MPRPRTLSSRQPQRRSRRQPQGRSRAAGPRKASGKSPRPRRSSAAQARAGPRKAERQDEVQEFLDDFTFLVTTGNGPAVAARFELPSLMVMADPKYGPSQVLDDRDKVATFFGQAPDLYHEKGIESTVPEIEDLRWLDESLAIVQVRFPYFDSDGNDLGDAERSVYLLRRQANADFAIAGVVALGTEADREARRRGRPVGNVGDQLA